MTDYIELINIFWDRISFFVYGIFCGYVVHFFEGEKMNRRNLQKITIFGFLTIFSNSITRFYFNNTNKKDEILVISITIACAIYFIGIYVFKPENKAKIGGIFLKYFAKKFGIEIENNKENKKIIIPNKIKKGNEKKEQ